MSEPIDLYDTPIDLRPVPKFTVEFAIDYLRERGDHYGANLLEAYVQEDAGNSKRAREEEGRGEVRG